MARASEIAGGSPKRGFSTDPARLIGAAQLLLVLLLLAAFWARNHSLRRKIAAEREAIRAKGEPLTVAEVKATYESLPSAENAAPMLLKATAHMHRDWPKTLPNFSYGGFSAEEILCEEQVVLAQAFLRTNALALEFLNQALEKHHAVFSLRWHMGMDTDHLHPIKELAGLLRLRFELNLLESPESAVRDIGAMVRLTTLLERETVVITYLVRISLLRRACEATQRLLNSQNLSLEQLRALQKSFAIEIAPRLVLQGERVLVDDALHQLTHRSRATHPDLHPLGFPPSGARITVISGLFLRDHLAFLKHATAAIDATTNSLSAGLSRIHAMKQTLELSKHETAQAMNQFHLHKVGSLNLVTHFQFGSFVSVFEKTALLVAELRMTRLALLLEEHRVCTGEYPAGIEVFAGKVSEEEFKDPFIGSRLRYLPHEHGFTLYSLGRDKTDQQGAPYSRERVLREEPYDLPFTVKRP